MPTLPTFTAAEHRAAREFLKAAIRNSPMEVTAREKRAAGGKDALLRQRLDAIGAGMPEGLFGSVQRSADREAV